MTTRKYIFLVLGIVFTLLDIYVTYNAYLMLRSFKVREFGIGFILRTQWLLLPGLIFFFSAYITQQKINRKNKLAMESAFND
jgi:hypothetical protein